MPYAKPTRVEVRVGVSKDLDEELQRGLKGPGTPQFEDLDVSPFMGVKLRGDGFAINDLSEAEQLVDKDGYTTWEFDVRPVRWGTLTLQLCVSLRIPMPGRPDERQSVPVLERSVVVQVGTPTRAVQFAARNWQWALAILTFVAGLGTAIAAWVGLFKR
jgi:hypothetical protein